jgi:hypothetical protein
MSMIEKHLRSALREVADEVPEGGVPPLRLPEGAEASPGAVRVLRTRRWLAPAAAAAALLVIVAAVAVIAGLRHPKPEPSSGGDSDRAPAYYVALTEKASRSGIPDEPGKVAAQIYATSTGRPVANLVPASLGLLPPSVFSAAADDRTFAFAAQRPDSMITRFYVAKFDPATGQVRVFELPRTLDLPRESVLDSLALSPDGTRVAITFVRTYSAVHAVFQLTVYDLAASTTRSWTSERGAFTKQDLPYQSLSWSGDSRAVAFAWYAGWQPNPVTGVSGNLGPGAGMRLLDTSDASGDLVSHSHLVLPFTQKNGVAVTPQGYAGPPLIVPDGKYLAAAITTFNRLYFEIGIYSTATGKLVRVVDRRPLEAISGPLTLSKLLWVSTDGRTLIVYAPPGYPGKLLVFHGQHHTVLPISRKIIYTIQGAPPAW